MLIFKPKQVPNYLDNTRFDEIWARYLNINIPAGGAFKLINFINEACHKITRNMF